ncbi:hypothetical protein [Streptomyces sp. BK79]|uniref:hypothetical protein n=1 Tax=Streptomyces sp. BK79 TaxID=3350097 RepID=UPI00376F4E74
MSDHYLTVIPTDPWWQPGEEAAGRAAAVLAGFLPDHDRLGEDEVKWHDIPRVVVCGENLQGIRCPRCGADLYTGEWFGKEVTARHEEGFATLGTTTPCCGARTSLNDLVYDWPCGFARFEIDVLYPERDWLSEEELARVAEALGHPVRQILSHW